MPSTGLIGVIVIVVALLNIILFFKVWGMTSNTDKIRLLLEAQRPDLEYHKSDIIQPGHYRERVQEKKD
jgi:hypothetical protein